MDLLSTDACTLPTPDRPLRLAEFDTLFAEALTGVVTDANTAVLRLSGGPGLAERVRDLTARESECCSFFAFSVTGVDADLTLRIEVPAEQVGILESLVARTRSDRTTAGSSEPRA